MANIEAKTVRNVAKQIFPNDKDLAQHLETLEAMTTTHTGGESQWALSEDGADVQRGSWVNTRSARSV
jgi:hypothetical protein